MKKLFCFPKFMSLTLSGKLTFRVFPHFFVRTFENGHRTMKNGIISFIFMLP